MADYRDQYNLDVKGREALGMLYQSLEAVDRAFKRGLLSEREYEEETLRLQGLLQNLANVQAHQAQTTIVSAEATTGALQRQANATDAAAANMLAFAAAQTKANTAANAFKGNPTLWFQLGQAVEDAQYGLYGAANNLTFIALAMGARSEIILGLTAVSVASTQIAKHWATIKDYIKEATGGTGIRKLQTDIEQLTDRTEQEKKALEELRKSRILDGVEVVKYTDLKKKLAKDQEELNQKLEKEKLLRERNDRIGVDADVRRAFDEVTTSSSKRGSIEGDIKAVMGAELGREVSDKEVQDIVVGLMKADRRTGFNLMAARDRNAGMELSGALDDFVSVMRGGQLQREVEGEGEANRIRQEAARVRQDAEAGRRKQEDRKQAQEEADREAQDWRERLMEERSKDREADRNKREQEREKSISRAASQFDQALGPRLRASLSKPGVAPAEATDWAARQMVGAGENPEIAAEAAKRMVESQQAKLRGDRVGLEVAGVPGAQAAAQLNREAMAKLPGPFVQAGQRLAQDLEPTYGPVAANALLGGAAPQAVQSQMAGALKRQGADPRVADAAAAATVERELQELTRKAEAYRAMNLNGQQRQLMLLASLGQEYLRANRDQQQFMARFANVERWLNAVMMSQRMQGWGRAPMIWPQ